MDGCRYERCVLRLWLSPGSDAYLVTKIKAQCGLRVFTLPHISLNFEMFRVIDVSNASSPKGEPHKIKMMPTVSTILGIIRRSSAKTASGYAPCVLFRIENETKKRKTALQERKICTHFTSTIPKHTIVERCQRVTMLELSFGQDAGLSENNGLEKQ